MTMTIASVNELLALHCAPAKDALPDAEAAHLAALLPAWRLEHAAGRDRLVRTFTFANYYETLAFINALAFITHQQDHHPEMTVTYNRCAVRYDTHSVNGGQGGLSVNDFICAAKADALLAERP